MLRDAVIGIILRTLFIVTVAVVIIIIIVIKSNNNNNNNVMHFVVFTSLLAPVIHRVFHSIQWAETPIITSHILIFLAADAILHSTQNSREGGKVNKPTKTTTTQTRGL